MPIIIGNYMKLDAMKSPLFFSCYRCDLIFKILSSQDFFFVIMQVKHAIKQAYEHEMTYYLLNQTILHLKYESFSIKFTLSV